MNTTDICNIALSRIGHEANVASIDPPEASAAARHCAKFYDIARRLMLESFNWSFATKHQDLAMIAESVNGFSYVYNTPSDFLKVVSIYGNLEDSFSPLLNNDYAGTFDKSAINYEFELYEGDRCIFTNIENAKIRYIFDQKNTTIFSAYFADALSWLLAHYLSGVMLRTEGLTLSQYCQKNYYQMLEIAKRQDLAQGKKFQKRQSSFVTARWS